MKDKIKRIDRDNGQTEIIKDTKELQRIYSILRDNHPVKDSQIDEMLDKDTQFLTVSSIYSKA